ncbi:hypothetical protein CFC21_087165 [Triticum aestivum]|uniref:F-box domain-containing protein n=3 Tax=Triticum TaxID=4564 RepID=A0A9R0YGA7_TRITD|nr:hypothetical protein CFC21_087165 [Triticum aestivum]VAI54865.1 unnamed protein product [Triticum turgidum subsp. durum]
MSSPVPHLVDEILEEIFLRLPTPATLARASTACPRFRSIITGRSFLRRYRKRHPPPLLGFATKGGFHPAKALHSFTPLAHAAAADFTYSFVPLPRSSKPWFPRDLRDGRVLLERRHLGKMFKSFVVCDPLSRRFVLLPSIPHDMVHQEEKRPSEIRPMLAPMAVGEQGEDETSFKVICFASYETKLVAFVFSSVTGEWSMVASTSWTSLGGRPHRCEYLPFSGCSHFYSAPTLVETLIVLDTRTMKFSSVDGRTGYHVKLRRLPGQAEYSVPRGNPVLRRRLGQMKSTPGILVDRDGALEMFSLVGDHSPNCSFYLYHTTRRNNGESSMEWQLEKIIPLPGGYDYFTVGAAEGFLFLGATTEDQLDVSENPSAPFLRIDSTVWSVDYFSLEVKTSKLMMVCMSKRQFFHGEHALW